MMLMKTKHQKDMVEQMDKLQPRITIMERRTMILNQPVYTKMNSKMRKKMKMI